MELPTEIIGIGVTVGLAGAGIIGGMLRWSILRNIEKLDESMAEIKRQVSSLASSLAQVREDGVTGSECAQCRSECQNRLAQYQREMLEWLRRQDDKLDRIVMMIANQFNGQGGINNGLPKPGEHHE